MAGWGWGIQMEGEGIGGKLAVADKMRTGAAARAEEHNGGFGPQKSVRLFFFSEEK